MFKRTLRFTLAIAFIVEVIAIMWVIVYLSLPAHSYTAPKPYQLNSQIVKSMKIITEERLKINAELAKVTVSQKNAMIDTDISADPMTKLDALEMADTFISSGVEYYDMYLNRK